MYMLNQATNDLEEIDEVTFTDHNLKERDHIEEWIRKKPDILDDELLIIGHEYAKLDTNERIDLLALNKEGALVIIELKRDGSGSDVEFQALKYCSYCSQLSAQDIIEIYREYLEKNRINENPLENISNHLDLDSTNEDKVNELLNFRQEFIIAGRDIDRRILSVCAWLSENGILCKCYTIKPYNNGVDENVYIDVNQIIPPYTINDYFIGKKTTNSQNGVVLQANEIISMFEEIGKKITESSNILVNYNPRKTYCIIKTGKAVKLNIVYSKRNKIFTIEILTKQNQLKQKLETFYNEHKEEIANEIQTELLLRKEGSKNADWCRIEAVIKSEDKDIHIFYRILAEKTIAIAKFLNENWK